MNGYHCVNTHTHQDPPRHLVKSAKFGAHGKILRAWFTCILQLREIAQGAELKSTMKFNSQHN